MTLPKVLLKIAIFHCVLLSISIALAKVVLNKEDPGKCNLSTAGKNSIVNDRNGNERVLICVKINGKYSWKEHKFFLGSSTLGEFFNPAEDCSDIVRKKRDSKSGLYWIKGFGLKTVTKVWCDLTTDGGGFMLIGYKNNPQSWTVPSNSSLVSPKGSPHWSSEFGNVPMLEFRTQISTTDNFEDSKADWLYRFTTPRRLNKLLINDEGCTKHYPGIGHINYVKDLLVGKIVTKNFRCSRFGPSYASGLGWEMMNSCLGKPCKEGYAIFPGTKFRYDKYGAFSYSAISPRSGIRHNSTAFIGCEHEKCCACYGPKGASGDFCTPTCQSINGGTVTKTSHTWFWVRSSVPKKPVWNKCTEFQVQTPDGKTETHFIDEITGLSKKGSCSKKEILNLVPGVVEVDNNKTLNSLPLVKGLLSYREDNTKLYLSNGQSWEALGKEKQDKDLEHRLTQLEQKLNNAIESLKVKSGKSCKDIYVSSKKTAASGVYWLRPLGGSSKEFRKAFRVYCDMETHGGGWTLVYSYTFTNYNNFASGSNAVTPRPNWPASNANVPISTTPPLDESSRGAIDFNLWKEIGKEILIKSNINDWIVCQPNGGSVVTKKNGPLNCQNIKNVVTKCQGIAPNRIYWHPYGPYLDASSLFYYFDGYTAGNWPTHDPCGTNSPNEKRGVANPGGAIYIR